MTAIQHILAAPEGGGSFKALIVIIAFFFWLFNAIASAVNKNKEKQRREQVQRELERDQRVAPLPQPTPQYRATPPHRPPSSPAPPRSMMKRPLLAPMKRPAVVPHAHFQPRPPAPRVVIAAPVSQISAPTPAPVARPLAVNATSLHAWMKPATLQKQFILTEVFQPPLGLRG